MRWTVIAVLNALLVVTVACDPGMTIRQNGASPALGKEEPVSLTIQVKTSHPLIGETKYAPEVKVTNTSDSPITITSAELMSGPVTYTSKPPRSGAYPLLVLPGRTESLDVWFDLNEPVHKTFKHACQLRLHYRAGANEGNAQTNIIGGHLDSGAP